MANIKEEVKYSQMPGVTQNGDKSWDDYEDYLNKEIFKNKIINIKIYFNQGTNIDITGISFTFKNLISRKIKTIEHKGSIISSEVKELNLEEDEYLSKFYADYDDKIEKFLCIGFNTNKNKILLVGKNNNADIYFNSDDRKNIIVGSFGYYDKRINSLGCLYYNKNILLKYDLFKFIMLRYINKKNDEFKKKIKNIYESLDITYKYIWRTINLPDIDFINIAKFCSLW